MRVDVAGLAVEQCEPRARGNSRPLLDRHGLRQRLAHADRPVQAARADANVLHEELDGARFLSGDLRDLGPRVEVSGERDGDLLGEETAKVVGETGLSDLGELLVASEVEHRVLDHEKETALEHFDRPEGDRRLLEEAGVEAVVDTYAAGDRDLDAERVVGERFGALRRQAEQVARQPNPQVYTVEEQFEGVARAHGGGDPHPVDVGRAAQLEFEAVEPVKAERDRAPYPEIDMKTEGRPDRRGLGDVGGPRALHGGLDGPVIAEVGPLKHVVEPVVEYDVASLAVDVVVARWPEEVPRPRSSVENPVDGEYEARGCAHVRGSVPLGSKYVFHSASSTRGPSRVWKASQYSPGLSRLPQLSVLCSAFHVCQ